MRRQQPAPFEHEPGRERPRGVRREQQTVEHTGIAMAQVLRKTRHLGVIAVAHEKGRRARERHHYGDGGNAGDVADRANDVAKPPHRNACRSLNRIAELRPVGCPAHPQEHRQVEGRVEQNAPRRAERQHDQPPDRRPDQNAKIPRGCHHAHRTWQFRHFDDVIKQQLA